MARDGFVLESQGGSLMKKTAVSTSWILLDQTGKGTILDVDKYAIMRHVDINARDLRILDPLLSYPSAILGREKVIVLNLEHIKAIITAEEVILLHDPICFLGFFFYFIIFVLLKFKVVAIVGFVRRSNSESLEVLLRDPLEDNVIPIVEELQRRLPLTSTNSKGQGEEEENPVGVRDDTETNEENEFPFEFRALEVALEGICSFLDARTRELETAAYPALDELTAKISSRNLDRVRKLKSGMTRLTNRVQKVREELEQLLDDDDDMADLYLSRKLLVGASSPATGSGAPNWFYSSPTIGSKISRTISRTSTATVREENDVEELEMLLEAYFMQIDGTLNKLTTLREYIDDTEDYINIQLDNHRNQLIQLELLLCSGTVCLSVYSLIAAIFGMNIPYTWREGHDHVFKWVVILTGLLCGSILVSIISYARHKGLVGS